MEEAELVANRAHLRHLLREHPDWPRQEYADQIGRSLGWVKKWMKRLREAPPTDEAVLWRRSSARIHPPPKTSALAIERILDIRDHPPENLHRTPGPKAILYYLGRDQALQSSGVLVPRSTHTIWQILTQHGRIAHPPRRQRVPMERPGPLQYWQRDFKDDSTVATEQMGKRQHVVETLNTYDVGTAVVLNAQVREDFTAETALLAVVETFSQWGLPDLVSVDRDVRWVGSASGRDFLSPFVRMLHCLKVGVYICPPQRPDKNGGVERYNKSYKYECLLFHHPTDLGQVREVTAQYHHHYNHERPNQAKPCGNRPPRVAFPNLPARPPLPDVIDPDGWVQAIHGQRFARKVKRDGSVQLEKRPYHIKQALAGTHVVLEVDGPAQELVVWQQKEVIKRLPIKGLQKQLLPWNHFVLQLREEARTEWRLYQQGRRAKQARG
ncbi:MAG TPA: integrase core domain-containing protein [Ktedonobacterales bacterium]|jgi:hypothetical protein